MVWNKLLFSGQTAFCQIDQVLYLCCKILLIFLSTSRGRMKDSRDQSDTGGNNQGSYERLEADREGKVDQRLISLEVN